MFFIPPDISKGKTARYIPIHPAYRATKDIKLIQEYCGHKNISDTDKYLRELGLIIPEAKLNNIPAI